MSVCISQACSGSGGVEPTDSLSKWPFDGTLDDVVKDMMYN